MTKCTSFSRKGVWCFTFFDLASLCSLAQMRKAMVIQWTRRRVAIVISSPDVTQAYWPQNIWTKCYSLMTKLLLRRIFGSHIFHNLQRQEFSNRRSIIWFKRNAETKLLRDMKHNVSSIRLGHLFGFEVYKDNINFWCPYLRFLLSFFFFLLETSVARLANDLGESLEKKTFWP